METRQRSVCRRDSRYQTLVVSRSEAEEETKPKIEDEGKREVNGVEISIFE
jgi:hypothetical protein